MSQLLSLAAPYSPGPPLAPARLRRQKSWLIWFSKTWRRRRAGKQVEITLEGCLQPLPGSSEVIYLLIRNLLENSIRHVNERGRVALKGNRAR